MANVELINIYAPLLENSNYGRGVKTQFDNIDKNFKTLGNHDFVKGASGAGYNFIPVVLTDDIPSGDAPTPWPQDESDLVDWINYAVKTAILNGVGIGSANPVPEDEQADCLSSLAGQIVLVYYLGSQDNENKEYVGIQPFPFYDGRIHNAGQLSAAAAAVPRDEAAIAKAESFEDRTGIICTGIVSDEIVFEILPGFPSIYYDEEIGAFCWKIGGQETGMPAEGPAGPDGKNGYILLVEAETQYPDRGANCYRVTSIYITHYDDGGQVISSMIPVNPTDPSNEPQKLLNELAENSASQTAMSFVVDRSTGDIYVSPITVAPVEGVIVGTVVKDEYTKLDLELTHTTIEDWFKSLNKSSEDPYSRSVFIPYVPGMQSNTGAHTLYSNGKTLILEPVSNINSAGTGNPDTDPTTNIEIHYPSMGMKSTSASVRAVFNGLYNAEAAAGGGTIGSANPQGEQRFTYIWQSEPKSGSYTQPGTSENRANYSEYDDAEHPFRSFMCPDGFLWYKDPYTYLRIELQNGKVMIIGPDNLAPASGAKTISPVGTQAAPITIAANQTTANASLRADTFWSITKTS